MDNKKQKVKKRSVEQLAALGNKGLLILMTQRAFGLSKQSKFEGCDLADYSESSVNGVQYALTNPEGKLMKLDEKSDAYTKILAKAKAAKASVETDKLDAPVNAFINELVALKGTPGAGGVRSGAILKGFSFK